MRPLPRFLLATAGLFLVLAFLAACGGGRGASYKESSEVGFDTSDDLAAWSPRGDEIVFTRDGRLFRVGSDGTGLRQIQPVGSEPAWSPDGREIAYTTNRGLYVMDASGRHVRQLLQGTEYSGPAWAPDGNSIAFTRTTRDEVDAIYVVAPNGREARPLIRPLLSKADHRWSPAAVSKWDTSWAPDGRRLAFVADSSGGSLAAVTRGAGSAVFVMNRDGTGRTRLGAAKDETFLDCGDPAWSPDGTRIAYSCGDELRVADLAMPHKYQLLVREAGLPSWSPDSKRIVFTRFLSGGTIYGAQPSALYIIGSDGSGLRRLTWGQKS